LSTYYASIEFSRKAPDGTLIKVNAGISQIERGTPHSEIVAMINDDLDFAISVLTSKCLEKLESADRLARNFQPAPEGEVDRVASNLLGSVDLGGMFSQPLASPPTTAQRDIPAEVEVNPDRARAAFGHHYAGGDIPSEWAVVPYTKDGGDSGKGQCAAINASLADIGYAGPARHLPCAILLKELGLRSAQWSPMEFITLDDLSRRDAHVLLDWISGAPKSSLDQLKQAIAKLDPFAVETEVA
jgi:hypothetical protein